MWILRADLTWYIISTNRSFHLSTPVALSPKSSSDGNPGGGGTAAVASALSWSTKSARLTMCLDLLCESRGCCSSIHLCVSRCNIYLEKKEIMINSRCPRLRFDKFKMVVVCTIRQNSGWRVLMLRQNSGWRSSSTHALLHDGDHARALGGVSVYNSIWCVPSLKFNVVTASYILHTFFRNFSSNSLFNDFHSTDANFRQMLRYL